MKKVILANVIIGLVGFCVIVGLSSIAINVITGLWNAVVGLL